MAGNGVAGVAVIGGGVAGLSVAHELAKRNFTVTVFEERDWLGGKAASYEFGGLPAEHGFRFFPGFYFHVVKTMKEIPAADGSGFVADHLVELDETVFADGQGQQLRIPLPTSTSGPVLWKQIKAMWAFRRSLPGPWEGACFLGVIARLANTCDARWECQLENQSWMEHVMPGWRPRQRSEKFRRWCAVGLTRSFVATRAEEMNTRTGGQILLQLLYDSFWGPPVRRAPDQALDGPTSKVWIDPWRDHLHGQDVNLKTGCTVTELAVARDGSVSLKYAPPRSPRRAPDSDGPGQEPTTERFDYYVLAVPCERLKQILARSPSLLELDPSLKNIFNLKTRWMNGIVFGLGEKIDDLPKGHVLCLDSEWALTLVDQTKFWANQHLGAMPVPYETLLSVDISDWETPGTAGLPAKWPPTRNDLVDDLWRQLTSHLPDLGDRPADLHFNLDFDIRYPRDEGEDSDESDPIGLVRSDSEPLLINTPESWQNRPGPRTSLPNLFIAADFARTCTNFASMEAANEAARHAVNELLSRAGYQGEWGDCETEPLKDPDSWWFRIPQTIAREVDSIIFRLALPLRPPFRLPIAAWVMLGLAAKLGDVGSRARRTLFGQRAQ
jgi:hypothetical protein